MYNLRDLFTGTDYVIGIFVILFVSFFVIQILERLDVIDDMSANLARFTMALISVIWPIFFLFLIYIAPFALGLFIALKLSAFVVNNVVDFIEDRRYRAEAEQYHASVETVPENPDSSSSDV